MRSASSSSTRSSLSATMSTKYAVTSWEVNALSWPPFCSTSRANWPRPWAGVPLNIMCSRKCAMPVAPRASLREPTRYQTWKDTIGLRWSSSSSTRSPLSSVSATTPSAAQADAQPRRSDPSRTAGILHIHE